MKRLMGILLTSMITVATVTPTWACTPPLHPPKMPDLEKAYEACREAGKKAVENVVIPDSYFKTETESETESETETEIQETETEAESETVETVVPESHSFWDYYKNWFKRFR